MSFILKKVVIALVFLMLLTSGLFSAPTQREHIELELISEVDSIEPGKSFWAAVKLKMDKGWHIYWKNPGFAGVPTTLKWSLPKGFKASPTEWPFPHRFVAQSVFAFGYENEIMLLTKIDVPQAIKSQIKILAQVGWAICNEETCLFPTNADLTIKLPVRNETAQPIAKWVKSFAHARSQLPLKSSDWTISVESKNKKFIIQLTPPPSFKDQLSPVTFFPEQKDIIDYSTPQKFKKNKEDYLIVITQSPNYKQVNRLKGVLVSKGGWLNQGKKQALQVDLSLVQTSEEESLFIMLLIAFIGGLILNLMPCVFPVLSIKVLSFVNRSGGDKKKVRLHGIMFTLGVLVSFLILAIIIVALRTGGEQLDWGFQLQSPSFVISLTLLFFLFGLNLMGVFEMGTSLQRLGQSSKKNLGYLNSFSIGILATVVGAPCMGPFMGSALGFTLTQPTSVTIMIFIFLGLGMALPYLLLSFIPALIRFIPKPGRWMESFRQLMGILLMGTAMLLIWVLGVMSKKSHSDYLASVLIGLLLVGLAGWVFGRWGTLVQSFRTRTLGRLLAVILLVGGLFFAYTTEVKTWQPYSKERVTELRKAGKPIFIDFTAAWCMTCQVNKQTTLNNSIVIQKFKELGVVKLVADLTLPDKTLSRELNRFGRAGVPLYVLYTSNPDDPPIILPEILTPSIVLNALKKVKSSLSASKSNLKIEN